MTSQSEHLPMWHHKNQEEQILIQNTRFKELLQNARVTLTNNLVLDAVWAHLRQLSVLFRIEEEALRVSLIDFVVFLQQNDFHNVFEV